MFTLPTAQSSFMAGKQQPARNSSRARKLTKVFEAAPSDQMKFAKDAKFAAKAKMGVRAALKLDLSPTKEDRKALLE